MKWIQCLWELYTVAGILVEARIDLNGLVRLIYEKIQLDGWVKLSILLNFGKNNVQIVVPIKRDKKNVSSYYVVSIVRDDGDLMLIVVSSCSASRGESRGEVIREISYYDDSKEKSIWK